jgi:cobaltochelatase CobS
MDNKQDKIQSIEKALAGQLDDSTREILQRRLETLKSVSVSSSMASSNALAQLQALSNMISTAGGVDDEEVKRIAEEVFSSKQISLSQLSPEVKDYIDKLKGVTISVVNVTAGGSQTMNVSQASQQRALFWVIMSDFAANNNVYLYGSAGTGKTFIAKEVANAIGYQVITINCNQFTSPLEIIGGQTIDGYQEGKLVRAWGNLELDINPETNKPYEGALLLIDELPKLDPNTAGIMNDALSTLKDPPRVVNGKVMDKYIYNGRNERIALKNFFAIGTGNTLLLRPDPNYTANFAQDASLQDRFAGSTYRVFYDYEMEYNKVLTIKNKYVNGVLYEEINMAFLFVFLIQMREAIERLGYGNEAFISARIMNNFKDTYLAYRINEMNGNPNPRPKTLQDGVLSFVKLFTEIQQTNLYSEVPIQTFIDSVIPEVNSRPLDNLSTEAQRAEAEKMVKNFNKTYGGKIF